MQRRRPLEDASKTRRVHQSFCGPSDGYFWISVPCVECNKNLSYHDQVVQQIVIHGMRDNDVRIRVLSRNTVGKLDTLEKLVDYIAAEEAGISESHNLNTQNTVGGLRRSSYKKSQSQTPNSQCRHCGQKHPTDRRKYCLWHRMFKMQKTGSFCQAL